MTATGNKILNRILTAVSIGIAIIAVVGAGSFSYNTTASNNTAASQNITASNNAAAPFLQMNGMPAATDVQITFVEKTKTVSVLKNASIAEISYLVEYDNAFWGYLIYKTYEYANGDLYYFLSYQPESEQAGNITIILPFTFKDYKISYLEYPASLDISKSLWVDMDSEDVKAIPKSTIYIKDPNLSGVLSYSSYFYEQPLGVLKESYADSSALLINENDIEVIMKGGYGSISEQWGIISQSGLFDLSDQETERDLQIADLNRIRKWCGDGEYYITPSTYFPSSPASFFKNQSDSIGEKFIGINNGSFFDDFAYLSLITSVEKQNSEGFWGTSARSQWLHDDYGIDAGYFDTRWDMEAALFLLNGFRRYGETEMLDASEKAADHYIIHVLSHHRETKNGGYLVDDYGYSQMPGIRTHMSLNHQLLGMNFLYELFITTQDARYKTLAEKLKKGIEDTWSSWIIKKTGDLYYCYLLSGRYDGQDYPLLTLNDLRYSQKLFKTVYNSENAYFTKLINAKETFLKKNNLPLY